MALYMHTNTRYRVIFSVERIDIQWHRKMIYYRGGNLNLE